MSDERAPCLSIEYYLGLSSGSIKRFLPNEIREDGVCVLCDLNCGLEKVCCDACLPTYEKILSEARKIRENKPDFINLSCGGRPFLPLAEGGRGVIKPMPLERAVEILNERKHRGYDNWSRGERFVEASLHTIGHHSLRQMYDEEAIAVAEKYEREDENRRANKSGD